MSAWLASSRPRRQLLLLLDLALRLAILYWLAEAWLLRDDPRFAGKAIPERNTIIVGTLSLLFPGIWWFRRLPWSEFPLGLNVVYLSIYALDMAGNSFDLYDRYAHFDLIPHLHGPGASSLILAVYWVRSRYPAAPALPERRWLLEATLIGAASATTLHVLLEAQEYYTDVIAGTANVRGVADTVNDLMVGVIGAVIYPPLAIRWFLPGEVRVGWRSVATSGALAAFAWATMVPFGPLVTDFVHDRVATPLPEEPLSRQVKEALLEAARAGAESRDVPRSGEVRHAHVSATPDELMAALTGDFQSIEGDVGMTGTVPVMRHDPRDPVGMTFLEWLEIVAAADFAIVKVDVKRDKVGPIVADLRTAVREYGLSEESLLINADVLKGPGAYGELNELEALYNRAGLELEPEDLLEMAEAFPKAAISIGLATGRVSGGGGYRTSDVAAVRDLAEQLRAGGSARVVVAARWDLLTVGFVEGMIDERIVIDVWNSLTIVSPANPDAEVERLRRRYGEGLGTIDLR